MLKPGMTREELMAAGRTAFELEKLTANYIKAACAQYGDELVWRIWYLAWMQGVIDCGAYVMSDEA